MKRPVLSVALLVLAISHQASAQATTSDSAAQFPTVPLNIDALPSATSCLDFAIRTTPIPASQLAGHDPSAQYPQSFGNVGGSLNRRAVVVSSHCPGRVKYWGWICRENWMIAAGKSTNPAGSWAAGDFGGVAVQVLADDIDPGYPHVLTWLWESASPRYKDQGDDRGAVKVGLIALGAYAAPPQMATIDNKLHNAIDAALKQVSRRTDTTTSAISKRLYGPTQGTHHDFERAWNGVSPPFIKQNLPGFLTRCADIGIDRAWQSIP